LDLARISPDIFSPRLILDFVQLPHLITRAQAQVQTQHTPASAISAYSYEGDHELWRTLALYMPHYAILLPLTEYYYVRHNRYPYFSIDISILTRKNSIATNFQISPHLAAKQITWEGLRFVHSFCPSHQPHFSDAHRLRCSHKPETRCKMHKTYANRFRKARNHLNSEPSNPRPNQ
jgi:hypothetical protein